MNDLNADSLKSLPIFQTQNNTSGFESSINFIENGTSSGTARELRHRGDEVSSNRLL